MALENTDDPDATSSILSLQRDVDTELKMHSTYMEVMQFVIVCSSACHPVVTIEG